MPIFDYREKIKEIPDDWKETGGVGIKIAVIDTGANLELPALERLDVPGRKFNVTLPGFDPETAEGNDDVSDTSAGNNAHGTQLLSILAAKSDTDSGIDGIAPEATYFIIKILDKNNDTLQANLIKALRLCIRLKVDIISNANAPTPEPPTMNEVDEAIRKLEEEGILFVSHLHNTRKFTRLNRPPFPSDYDYALAVGVAQKKLLATIPNNPEFSDHVKFLFPELEICTLTKGGNNTGSVRTAKSSHSTAIFSGLAALFAAKATVDDASGNRKTKNEIIEAMEGVFPLFSKQGMVDNTELKFFHTKKPLL